MVLLGVAGLGAWKNQSFFNGPPLHPSLNTPGEVVNLAELVSPGNTTIVHYYADWCPGCSKWADTMRCVEAQFTDISVVYVNIGSFDSAVARQHGIEFVPNFKVFDRRGQLIAEDKAADRWVRNEIDRRLAARRTAVTRVDD